MDEKITIIEGPPPTFEVIDEGWAFGLADSQNPTNIAVTHLRTFNGPALVERCHRAWRKREPIHLEYRDEDGLGQKALILAARTLETEGGQVLILWVRLPRMENDGEQLDELLEEDYEDFDEEDEDDEDEYPNDEYDNPDDNGLLPPPQW